MIFYCICDGVNTAARVWFVFQVMGALFSPKWVKSRMRIGWVGMMVFAVQNQLDVIEYKVLFSNFVLLVIVLSMAAVCILLYECSFWNSLWLNMLSWIGMALLDFFIQTCVYLILCKLGGQRDILLSFSMERSGYLSIYTAIIILAGIKLRRWLVTRKWEVLYFKKQGLILGFLMMPILVYFQIIYMLEASGNLLNQWWIFWLGLVIVVLVFWFNMVRHKTEEEKRIQQLEVKMLDEKYQDLLHIYNRKSIIIHDMQNHLRTILEMIEEEQVEECRDYLIQISGEIQKKESLPWTNHKILDMIFNMKFQEARKEGIRIKCLSDDLSGLELTVAEICSFFTNLLDNAIEASMKCQEEERQIRIVCRKKGGMLVVSISNPVEKDAEYRKKQMLITTKKDKSMHGFGMLSMENIIHGHDGYIKTDIAGDQFQVIAYLNAFADE